MRIGDLGGIDRTVAIINVAVALILVTGLGVSGTWQFIFHDPNWDNYVVGTKRPLDLERTTMADIHATLGDLATAFALWMLIWLSYRILSRISRPALAVLVILSTAVITGPIIRVNAVVRDGVTDPASKGYAELFGFDFDIVIASDNALGPTAIAMWTTVHIVAVPLALYVVWFSFRNAKRRRDALPPADSSWLDRLVPTESTSAGAESIGDDRG